MPQNDTPLFKSHSQEDEQLEAPTDTKQQLPTVSKQKTSASDDAALPRNQESHGLLGSLMSAAHNAANIISSKRDSSAHHENTSSTSLGENPRPSSQTSDPDLQMLKVSPVPSINVAEPSKLLASNVHFEPVHESPVNTLGNGDLTLLHFEDKGAGNELRPRRTHSQKEKGNGTPHKLTVSGSHDSKVVRKKSMSNHSNADSEHTLETNDAEYNAYDALNHSSPETESTADSPSFGEPNSKKRKEFRNSFKNVPASEELLAEFSCALSKDILVHGKLYLTKNFICFNSNILGWVTNLVIPIQEIIQIEKKSTAVLFPNGMIVKTLHQKYVFASFLSRDATFSLITKVWNNSLRENRINNSSRLHHKDGLRPVDLPETHVSSNDESTNELDVELEAHDLSSSDDGHDFSFIKKIKSRRRNSTKTSEPEKDTDSRSIKSEEDPSEKKSEAEPEADKSVASEDNNTPNKKVGIFKGFQNPGPASHKPTKPTYPKDNVHIIDYTFKAPLGVVYSLLYGPDKSTYVKILELLKNFGITKSSIVELNSENKERHYTYIKPLSSSLGPKQTKCVITEALLNCNFEDYCEIEQITQTPDVPLGGSFKVKTRQFLSWDADNATKFSVYTNIEWSAKSWIKGAIEKGSLDGQKSSMKDLTEVLSDILSSGASSGSKPRRKKTKSISQHTAPETSQKTESKPPPTITEQLQNLLESIGSAMPISVGFLGNKGLGLFSIVLLSFVYSFVLLKLANKRGESIVLGAGSPLTVHINKDQYYLTPTIDTQLRNKENRLSSSAELWQWILSRSGEVGSRDDERHTSVEASLSEEYKEILRLTKQRVDEAYNALS